MISDKERRALKKELEKEYKKLEQSLESFTREFKNAPGEHETFIQQQEEESNPEDAAQTTEEYNRLKALELVLEKRLNEIRQALEIIDTPQYAICTKCAAQIPIERLRVNPAAMTCLKCANSSG